MSRDSIHIRNTAQAPDYTQAVIYPNANGVQYLYPMDIYAIRLQNIRSLIGTQVKNRTELAEKLRMAYELLSNYIGKNPTKNVGDELARRVEQTFTTLPYGWSRSAPRSHWANRCLIKNIPFRH